MGRKLCIRSWKWTFFQKVRTVIKHQNQHIFGLVLYKDLHPSNDKISTIHQLHDIGYAAWEISSGFFWQFEGFWHSVLPWHIKSDKDIRMILEGKFCWSFATYLREVSCRFLMPYLFQTCYNPLQYIKHGFLNFYMHIKISRPLFQDTRHFSYNN